MSLSLYQEGLLAIKMLEIQPHFILQRLRAGR